MRCAYRRLKTNREENLTIPVGFVHACEKNAKNRKINEGKGVDKLKKQNS